jgi:hypothetical protein
LVGDNSSNQNWGGRAASIALYRLLERKFEFTGTILGSAFLLPDAGFGFVQTLLPARYNWLYLNLNARRHRRRTFDCYIRIEEFFGARDFIASDPAETVQNILKHRHKHPRIDEIYQKAVAADVLIINGEGDIVLTSPPRREALFLLGMAALGLHLQKRVVFINSMISDCPLSGRNNETVEFLRGILSRCDVVTLRDRQSFKYVAEVMPEVQCHLVPDSLFAWFSMVQENRLAVPANGDFILPFPDSNHNFGKLDFSKPYICLGGSALAARDHAKSSEYFIRLLLKLQNLGYPVYLVETCSGDAFLQTVAARTGAGLVPVNTAVLMGAAILGNARLFVSGRYHPTIMASLGGTPSIFLQSSAHKMHSLQDVLEYEQIREFSISPSLAELDAIVSLGQHYLKRGEELRKNITSVARRRCDETLRLPGLLLEQMSPARTANPQLASCRN